MSRRPRRGHLPSRDPGDRRPSPAQQHPHLDMSDVSFMDSSSLTMLLRLRNRSHAEDFVLKLSGLREQAQRVLELTGALPLFPIHRPDVPTPRKEVGPSIWSLRGNCRHVGACSCRSWGQDCCCVALLAGGGAVRPVSKSRRHRSPAPSSDRARKRWHAGACGHVAVYAAGVSSARPNSRA
ncbi:STAS domain-containing protein [Streptomyces sp. NPDC059828]|uniref:STAS domain-containing protein n=1 Tax=Streptomyces sp. NPDC059828 TaxID=3346965 RepID=UPI003664D6B2